MADETSLDTLAKASSALRILHLTQCKQRIAIECVEPSIAYDQEMQSSFPEWCLLQASCVCRKLLAESRSLMQGHC